MLEYIEGNIFDSPAQVIVNTVNTVGVMGKGLALTFKNKYPKMFDDYKTVCEKRALKTGKLMLFYFPDHWVLLFPTKEHWRNPSKLKYIEDGLVKFVNSYAEKSITSIAFPKLGCGNGELSWDDVRPIMEKHLKPLPIDIYIYTGPGEYIEPEHKNPKGTMDWLKRDAKNMSFRGVLDDVEEQCRMIPYIFENGWTVERDKDNYIFKSGDEEYRATFEELYEIWDEVRNDLVFKSESNNKKRVFCKLLNNLGYISKVRIMDKQGVFVDGYQLNEGRGRAFGLEE